MNTVLSPKFQVSGQPGPNPLVVRAIFARIAEWKKELENDQVRGARLKMRAKVVKASNIIKEQS